jgi:protein-tyrosine phosphatase
VFWPRRKIPQTPLIDIHCHILPGVDDGPATLTEALEMARIAVGDGTRRIVATPHVKDRCLSPEEIRSQTSGFNEELRKAGLSLEVLPGAELEWHVAVEDLSRYTLNGSTYALIELPPTHIPADARQVLFNALVAGFKPVIAHPERHPSIIQRPQLLLEWVEAGALVQMTGESLEGNLGPDVQSCARFLLKKQAVHFLASDGHGSSWRLPILSKALDQATALIGPNAALRLVTSNPEAVLKGSPLG